MKFFKWSFIGVGAVIAVFLFLLIGVRLYLNTDRAQQQLQAQVSQAIPGTIIWSKSRLSLWRGEVELHNVLLSAPLNDKLVELKRIFLRISWNRLLKGELCVNNLFFETPRIYLKTDRLGNFNLVQALSPPENSESKPMDSGLPFNVVIRELKVLNGFFQYQTAEDIAENQKNRMVFQDVNLTIRDGDFLKQKARLVCKIHGGNIAGKRIDRINLSCHLKDKCLTINDLNLYTSSGSFELSGAIDLKAYRPSRVELKLKAHDLPLMIPDTLETRLSAELDIKGTPEKSLVSGYIQMIEGQYYKNIRLNLMESLGKKSREQALPASEIPWPFLKNMALDITTRCIEPFVIDNNMALLAIKPDLRIYGSMNHPLISGRAQVESGTVYFQKKEFNVKRGVFDFINPYKIEPTIDVLSEIIVREWTVFLSISGTPDNLKFNFSSNPSEREEDILSLLITGKTTRELIAGEGGSSLSPGQILADVFAETVQKQIKDAVGLDVVELEYKEGGKAEASDEVKVTVGKELSRRITVKYGVQTKNAKVIQQVITEYKILEKLLINTFHDTEGHYGGGLQFRFEFR